MSSALAELKALLKDILDSPTVVHTAGLLSALIQLITVASLNSITPPSLSPMSSPRTTPIITLSTSSTSSSSTATSPTAALLLLTSPAAATVREEVAKLERAHSQLAAQLKAKDFVLTNAASEIALLRAQLMRQDEEDSILAASIASLSPSAASARLRELAYDADHATAQFVHAEVRAAAERRALHTRLRQMDLLAARAGEFPAAATAREPSLAQCAASRPPSPPSFMAFEPPPPPPPPTTTTVSPSSSSASIGASISPMAAIPAQSKVKQVRSAQSSSGPRAARPPLQPIRLKEAGAEEFVQTPGKKGGKVQLVSSSRSSGMLNFSRRQKVLKEHWAKGLTGAESGYARVSPEGIAALLDSFGYVVTKQMARFILNQMTPKGPDMVTWNSFSRVMTDYMNNHPVSK